MLSAAALILMALFGAVAVDARHIHGKHAKMLSSITAEVTPGAPAEQSVTLQGQPLFRIDNLTSPFTTNFASKRFGAPSVALIPDVYPTSVTINYSSVPVTLGPVQATLTFKQGGWRKTHVYDVDSLGETCLKKTDGFACTAGSATLGPLLLPAAEEFPAHTHQDRIITSIELHDHFGVLVLSAHFEVQIVVTPSMDDHNDHQDAFDMFDDMKFD